jgi:glutathione S-transferase
MLPKLYSYRRCPYAIRARFTLNASRISYQLEDVDLKNKPEALLKASPKGTVPVLILADGTVIDESLDIMYWALSQNDPGAWLPQNAEEQARIDQALTLLDQTFIPCVYRARYPDRYPPEVHDAAVLAGEAILATLSPNAGLWLDRLTVADIAWFPFIRQWPHHRENTALSRWLTQLIASDAFADVMQKNQPTH